MVEQRGTPFDHLFGGRVTSWRLKRRRVQCHCPRAQNRAANKGHRPKNRHFPRCCDLRRTRRRPVCLSLRSPARTCLLTHPQLRVQPGWATTCTLSEDDRAPAVDSTRNRRAFPSDTLNADLRGIAYTVCTMWLMGLMFYKVPRTRLSAVSVASNSIPLDKTSGKSNQTSSIETVIDSQQ